MAGPDTVPGQAWPGIGIVPDWPAPANVHALFTTREGGASAAPFDSFNLGDHVRDEPLAVQANRQALAARLGARPVFLQQVHGDGVVRIGAGTPDGTQADACVATEAGVVCTIMVADCLPVLFTDVRGAVVAAAHAGWRGLAGTDGRGVLEATVATLTEAGARADELLAWLGPCIGPAQFEVGPEVRATFVAADAAAHAAFVPSAREGRFLADLPMLARQRLRALGVTRLDGNDGTDPWCTVSQASRFFSHRRDAARLGSTGRMAACIGLA